MNTIPGANMTESADPRLVRWAQRLARLANAAVILVALLGLLGWYFEISFFRRLYFGIPTPSPLTAVAFFMSGLSLWLFHALQPGDPRRHVGTIFGVVVIVIAGFEFCESWLLVSGSKTNPVEAAVAINFALIGLSLVLRDMRVKGSHWPGQAPVVIASVLSMFLLILYLYSTLSARAVLLDTPNSLNTTLGLGLLCIGILLGWPNLEPAATIVSRTAGGTMARHLLPASVILPLVLGWVWLQASRSYGVGTALAFFALSIIAAMNIMIWWNARSLAQFDMERRASEQALRQSEARLMLALEAAHMGSWDSNLLTGELAWSAAVAPLFGLTREEFGGTREAFYECVHEEDRELVTLAVSQAAEEGVDFDVEHRVVWPDESVRWLENKGRVFRDDTGKSLHMIGTVMDITQRKQAQLQLQEQNRLLEQTAESEHEANEALKNSTVALERSREELRVAMEAAEKANRAKSEFLANMSHEIRTPMNGIMGMTELLSHTDLTLQQREYLGLMSQSSNALLMLLNDILDFSKIEAGRLELESIGFDLRDTIGDTVQTLAVRAAEKGLELACHISPGVPNALTGDPGRLRQILINLADNAIKFTEDGEVVVDVKVNSEDEEKVTLQVSVSDTGIGIPKKQQDLIFESFSQVDSSTSRRFGGTGLGLAISSQLSSMMGGRMWVESELNKGSTFYFTAHFAKQAGVLYGDHSVLGELAGLRVLVVDDSSTNRGIMVEMLENWQMIPRAVESAELALKEMKLSAQAGEPYRIVLLDAVMPEMDGFEAAERIKQDVSFAEPVLMLLSSAGRHDDSRRCVEMGIDRCLSKPVKQSDLMDAIVETLDLAPNAPTRTAQSNEPHVQAQPRRVLLAEDGIVNQKVALDLLTQRGHSVVVANHGKEVLAALEKGPFDLILMDIQMPEMDGFETTEAIRKQEKATGEHLPIFAMTAHAMKGDRERCLDAGMDGYLSKPIRVDKLYEAVEGTAPGVQEIVQDVAVSEESTIFDWADALDRFGGNEKTLKELAQLFLDECPKMIGEIEQAISSENAKALRRAAHTLKGSAAIFAATPVVEAAYQVESIGREGNLEEVEEAIVVLKAELKLLTPDLIEKMESIDC